MWSRLRVTPKDQPVQSWADVGMVGATSSSTMKRVESRAAELVLTPTPPPATGTAAPPAERQEVAFLRIGSAVAPLRSLRSRLS